MGVPHGAPRARSPRGDGDDGDRVAVTAPGRCAGADHRRTPTRATMARPTIGETGRPGRRGASVTKVRGDREERAGAALRRAAAAAAPLVVMLVGARVVWRHVPWGVALYGGELGLLSATIAVGLSLTYRANRIINFA